MTLNADRVVKVTASIASTGLLRRDFGRTLFITKDVTLPSNERVRTYSNADGVAEDFAVGTAPYEASSIYFQQSPFPKNFMPGRFFSTTEPALLKGGSSVGSVADFAAISDASFALKIDLTPDYDTEASTEFVFSAIDLTAVESLADVAAAIETKILAVINGQGFDVATFDFDATLGGFVLSITADDTETIVTTGYVYAAGVGTDISELLAMDIANATYKGSSTVIEEIEDALSALVAKDNSFYFITVDNTITDTDLIDRISAWTASRPYMFIADSSDLATLNNSDSAFVRLAALSPSRTVGVFSRTADYKAVSTAGRLSSVNFDGSNTLITMKFKELPGTTPDTYTESQATVLNNLGVNFYSKYDGDVLVFEEGYTFDKNVWIDVRYWLDWFVNAVQVAQFNLLKNSPTRVPQTDAGQNALQKAINSVCEQGIKNGGIAGGQLSAALTLDVQQTTGNTEFDGYLADGYLVYCDAIRKMPQTNRAQRKSQPFKVYLKGSGAIHFADVEITFEN